MKISLIFPLYNEQDVIVFLRKNINEWLLKQKYNIEILIVNDGSTDGSLEKLRQWSTEDDRVKVLSFSRNFGHQAALTAGLDNAKGDVVVTMDADMQDPLVVVDKMIKKYGEGFDIVHSQRISRSGESFLKKLTAWIFYRLFNMSSGNISLVDSGDFKLVSRKALNTLVTLREKHRFLRGMYCWIGFKNCIIRYNRNVRVAGITKFPYRKMFGFAWDALLSFSVLPIRLISIIGFAIAGFGFMHATYSTLRFFIVGDNVQGWTTIIILQSLIGGFILISLGTIGEYIGRIYEEIKGRPLYVIDEKINF